MTDETDETDGTDSELDAGLEAAFQAIPADSVLARLVSEGTPARPVLLREEAAPPPPVLGPAGATEGRYQILGEIARGGVGVVLRGHDVDLGRDVAMKVLRPDHADAPELVQRFVEEAQIGGQLQHPGIVPVYEMGLRKDRRPYFTMKLVKGRTLGAILADVSDLARERGRLLKVFEAVCQTMAYAHARGVVHRDLKPANVMVGSFGEVLVVDWGMGKVLREGGVADESRRPPPPPDQSVVATQRSRGRGSQSMVGSVMGTPRYMPPEQARGETERLDERCDVFALGAMLCELVTGQPPYVGPDEETLLRAARADLGDAWARLEACGADPQVVALARACLAPAPEARPRSAVVVAKEMAGYLASLERKRREAEAEAERAQVRAEEERKRRRLSTALAAAVLGLVLLGGGGWLWLEGQRRARRDDANRQVAAALDEASAARGRAVAATSDALPHWMEAASAARRAEGFARDADEATRERARALLAELEAAAAEAREREAQDAENRRRVARLDDIRASRSEHGDPARSDREYAEVFREVGIDVEGTEPAAVVGERLRRSEIATDLVAAMHDWAAARARADLPNERLRAVLDAGDPDPWRARVRAAKTLGEVQALVAEADVDRAPVAILLHLADRLEASGDAAGARRFAARVQARHPGDFWANLTAAWTAHEDEPRAFAEAVRYYGAAVAIRPSSPNARNNLGSSLNDVGEPEAARRELEEARRLDPGYAAPLVNLGVLAYERGDVDGAMRAYREAMALDPTGVAAAHHNLGNCLVDKGDAEGALASYREAVKRRPRQAAFRVSLARHLGRLGRMAEAVAELQEAVRLRPAEVRIRLHLAEALKEVGDTAGAEAAVREALRRDPASAEARAVLGVVSRARGDLEGAVRELREALRRDPDLATARNSLGDALREGGDLDAAVAELREAIRLDPKSPDAHLNLGAALADLGRFDEAVVAYREALRLKPSFALARVNLGNVLLRTGDATGALEEARAAVQDAPQDGRAHAVLGQALHATGEVEAALEAYRESLRVGRRAPRETAMTRVNYGTALADSGDFDAALEQYREAQRLDATVPQAHNNVGIELERRGELAAALAAYREAERLDPGDPLFPSNVANLLREAGHLKEAVEAARRAVALDLTRARSHASLADALAYAGDVEGAISSFGEAIRHDPKGPTWRPNRASLLRIAGRTDEALREIEAAVAMQPDDPYPRLVRGDLLKRAGRLDEAVAALRLAADATSGDPQDARLAAEVLPTVERLAALATRLDAVVSGADRPAGAEEEAAFARIAYWRGRPADSARLYERALRSAAQGDAVAEWRYEAACSAALAGSDRGGVSDEKARAGWRRKGLEWLRACLGDVSKRLEEDGAAGRRAVRNAARVWRRNRDLASLRDEAETARLPAKERDAARALWRDLYALEERAKEPL
jgi:serine/threonine-protein kinase